MTTPLEIGDASRGPDTETLVLPVRRRETVDPGIVRRDADRWEAFA